MFRPEFSDFLRGRSGTLRRTWIVRAGCWLGWTRSAAWRFGFPGFGRHSDLLLQGDFVFYGQDAGNFFRDGFSFTTCQAEAEKEDFRRCYR